MYIINFIRGFCMALADSVPGVSGGTVVFLLGFYDKFISSLDDLVSGSWEKKKIAGIFLIKIGIGWVTGFCIAVLILGSIFDKQIYNISSLFMGFIIFALPLVMMEEKKNLKGHYKNAIFLLIGIVLVALITYFNPVAGNGMNIDVNNLTFGLGIYIFFVAMIAIAAMVLPGISGSTLLLIFGLYIPIITAIKEFLHFNFAYMPVLLIFGCGILAGIAITIRLIRIAIDRYHSQTIYTILGLMIGSLYAIVMGPTTLEVPQAQMGFETFSIMFFLIGGIVIFGMQKLKDLTTIEETVENEEKIEHKKSKK